MSRGQVAPSPPTAGSILAVLRAIERHPVGSPAAAAFRSALRRIGLEADAAGGLAALDALLTEVAAADRERAEARQEALRAAWGELLPSARRRPEPEVS